MRSIPLPPLTAARREDADRAKQLAAAATQLHHALLSPIRVNVDDGLDPQEAAALAMVGNWDLAAARDGRRETLASLHEARLLPNPSMNRGVDNPTGAGSEGLHAARSFDLSLGIRPLVTRAARVSAERANLKSVELGLAWQEWQIAQSARMQTVRLGWLRRRLETLREDLIARANVTELLGKSVARGDFTRTELELQRTALQAQRSHERELVRTEEETESALVGVIGLDPDTELNVTRPELPAVPLRDPDEHALLEGCFDHRLDLQALRAGYDAQESRLRQSLLEQIPNLSVGMNRNRDEAGLKFLGGFIDLDLPAFNHNQGAIAAADATRARLKHEYEGRIRAIHGEIRLLSETLATLDAQIADVSAELTRLAQLEQHESAALERGDVSRLELEAVRAGRLDLQLEIESLAQQRDEALLGRDTSCGGAALSSRSPEVQP